MKLSDSVSKKDIYKSFVDESMRLLVEAGESCFALHAPHRD